MPSVSESHPATRGVRSTTFGMVINVLLASGKGVAGILGHSSALIADAIESLTDVLSSAVILIGLRISMRPADENHPYGHGKAEPLAATVVSLALFGAAVTIAIESIHEIRRPHFTPAPFTLGVLAAVVLVKEVLFRYVLKVGEGMDSTAVRTDAWHHRSDAITSALAFVGISIALIGGRGWESADDWAALLAAGIIAYNAYRMLRPAVMELTDSVPGSGLGEEVRRVARSVPGVLSLDKCFVRKMGLDYYVDLHVIVDRDMPVWRGHEIAHEVKDKIRASRGEIIDVLIHIEPSPRDPQPTSR